MKLFERPPVAPVPPSSFARQRKVLPRSQTQPVTVREVILARHLRQQCSTSSTTTTVQQSSRRSIGYNPVLCIFFAMLALEGKKELRGSGFFRFLHVIPHTRFITLTWPGLLIVLLSAISQHHFTESHFVLVIAEIAVDAKSEGDKEDAEASGLERIRGTIRLRGEIFSPFYLNHFFPFVSRRNFAEKELRVCFGDERHPAEQVAVQRRCSSQIDPEEAQSRRERGRRVQQQQFRGHGGAGRERPGRQTAQRRAGGQGSGRARRRVGI